MPNIRVEYEGLDEIIERMQRFPRRWHDSLNKTLYAVLFKIWEYVPPYPPPPKTSRYIRTGTLGRSLGSGFRGGRSGMAPGIFEKKIGSRFFSATFGTRLEYAPYVIGEEQAKVHQGRWWTMAKLAKDATRPVLGLFEAMMRGLARWLEGQNV